MKDFTVSSMTQSFASVTSLPRDVSCEDFDSSSADKTMTEECNVQAPSSNIKVKSNRCCLDSSKLEEIEALTESPPMPKFIDVPHILSDISEINELSESQESLPLPKTRIENFTISEMLNERTEKLLQKSSRNSNKSKIQDEYGCTVPEKAKYRTEAEIEEKSEKIVRKLSIPRTAWPQSECDTAAAAVVNTAAADVLNVFEAKVTNNPAQDIDCTSHWPEKDKLANSFENDFKFDMEGQKKDRNDFEKYNFPSIDGLLIHQSSSDSCHDSLPDDFSTDAAAGEHEKKFDTSTDAEPIEEQSEHKGELSRFTFHKFSQKLGVTNLSAKLNDPEGKLITFTF